MVYVLYGDEKFLLEQKLNDLREKYKITKEDMNESVYDAMVTPIHEIMEDCNMTSFFSEYKMVIIKNPYFCTNEKVNEALRKQDISELEKFIQSPLKETILVIYHTKKNFDERKRIVKLLKKNSQFVLLEKLDPLKMKATIRQAIKNRGSDIEREELDYLMSYLPENLMEALSEVEKLCLYTDHITKEDIELVVTKPREQNAFELVNAVLRKDQAKAISIYQDLMVMNEEPIKLIVIIAGQFRLLYQVKILSNKGYTDQEMGKMLGINPFRVKYIRRDMRRFELNDLTRYLDELSILDVQIKKGEIDKQMALELFLMKVGE